MSNSIPFVAPPVAPVSLANAQADILEEGIISGFDGISIRIPPVPSGWSSSDSVPSSPISPGVPSRGSSSSSTSSQPPPSFSDLVKRSTRFITSVPAFDVLDKLLCVLNTCRDKKSVTAIGIIGRVDLIVETYRIEVWGNDMNGQPIMVSRSPANNLFLLVIELG